MESFQLIALQRRVQCFLKSERLGVGVRDDRLNPAQASAPDHPIISLTGEPQHEDPPGWRSAQSGSGSVWSPLESTGRVPDDRWFPILGHPEHRRGYWPIPGIDFFKAPAAPSVARDDN